LTALRLFRPTIFWSFDPIATSSTAFAGVCGAVILSRDLNAAAVIAAAHATPSGAVNVPLERRSHASMADDRCRD